MLERRTSIAAVLLAVGAALPVCAQPTQAGDPDTVPGGIELKAQQGLTTAGGINSRWVPIEVAIENRAQGRSVQLIVKLLPSAMEEGSVVVRRTITLAPGAKRREWFVLPANPASTQLRVEVREPPGEDGEEGKLLRRIEPQLYHYTGYRQGDWTDAHVLYVAADGREVWRRTQWLQTYGNQGLLGMRPPETLPDRALAYTGLDMVVLHDADTRGMSSAQRAALEGWVAAGGTVLLVPGKQLSWFNEPLIRTLLGETTINSLEVQKLPTLGGRYSPAPVRAVGRRETSAFALYVPEAPSQRPPSGNWERRLHGKLPGGKPFDLAHEVRFGRGRVFVLAADLSAEPFKDWPGGFRDTMVADLRRRVLRDSTSVLAAGETAASHRFGYYNATPFVRPELTRILNSNRDPSRLFVILLVIVYIVVVGPLNYRFLRKRDRQMLLVATVPIISFVFCLAIVLSGYATKGLQTLVWRVTVVSTDLGSGSGLEQTGLSIRSASGSDYEVELDPALVGTRVFNDSQAYAQVRQSLVDDGSFVYPRVQLQLWEQATFEGFALRDLGDGLQLRGRWPRVDVVNGTPWTLRKVAVVRNGRVYVVGRLGQGDNQRVPTNGVEIFTSHPVKRTAWFAQVSELMAEDEDEVNMVGRVLMGYAPYVQTWRGSTYVLAVLDRSPSEVKINGSPEADREISILVARERSGR